MASRQEYVLFARNFLKHPNMLGAFAPSSRYLVERVLDIARPEEARLVVEYGPGSGTLTRPLLCRLDPDTPLVAFETNHELLAYLRSQDGDARLHLVHGRAEDAARTLHEKGLPAPDLIVSGIPFGPLTEQARLQLVQTTHDLLRPGGRIVVYQFLRAAAAPLRQVFGNMQEVIEPRNILPMRIFSCHKDP